jgi:erythritol/L-threitol dehydrogenase
MAEPLSCCVSAFRSAALKKEDWVAIIGAGPTRLLNLLVAKSYGFHTMVIDILSERLEKAREFGADHLINSKESDPVQTVRSLTEVGADLVIGALGDIEVINDSLPMVRNGGLGVRMSSWGSALFAFGEDLKGLQKKTQRFLDKNMGGTCFITKANNQGMKIL